MSIIVWVGGNALVKTGAILYQWYPIKGLVVPIYENKHVAERPATIYEVSPYIGSTQQFFPVQLPRSYMILHREERQIFVIEYMCH